MHLRLFHIYVAVCCLALGCESFEGSKRTAEADAGDAGEDSRELPRPGRPQPPVEPDAGGPPLRDASQASLDGGHRDAGVDAGLQERPVARVTTAEDTPIEFKLPASVRSDAGAIFHVLTEPTHGTLELSGDTATFTPDPDFN